MKRILAAGLVLLLICGGGGGLALVPPTAVANSPEEYEALVRYFAGEITREQLEEVFPPPAAPPATGAPAVIGATKDLVSNTGQTAPGDTGRAFTDKDFVQEFTTGALTGTKVWRIESVAVEFTFNVPSPTTRPTIEIQIHSSSSGRPTGSALGTLRLPAGQSVVAGSTTYVSQSPIQLNPGTAYVVLVNVNAQSSGSGGDVRVTYTSSNDEDAGGVADWSIGATAFNRTFTDTGNAFSGATNGQPIKIAIRGHEYTPAVGETPPPAPFELTHGELADYNPRVTISQSSICGGKPHPVHEAFRRDPLGTDLSALDSLFCNESTGQWVTGKPYQQGVHFSRPEDLITPGDSRYPAKCRYDKPTYRHNADGTTTVIHGANYDPLADVCTQRGTALDN